jgi:putative transposase
MRQQKYSETQILRILKEYEQGISVSELSRKYGFYSKTLYSWRKKYAGITDSSLQELKELQKENDRLKKMYANLSLENHALKDLIEKKL